RGCSDADLDFALAASNLRPLISRITEQENLRGCVVVCVKCQREIEAESSYCRFCGAAVRNPDTARRFVRLPDEGRVAGVCAGLAAYFDADITLVRLVWVTL